MKQKYSICMMALIKRQELRETVYKWLSTTLKVREYLQNGE